MPTAIRKYIETVFQTAIDKLHGKTIDIICISTYLFSAFFALRIIVNIIALSVDPMLKTVYSPYFYAVLLALPMVMFHVSLAGDYLSKPHRRLPQFYY